MSKCDRIYYATHQLAIAKEDSTDFDAIRGLQTSTINADIPLEEIFQIGKLSPVTQLENLPDVTVSTEKVLDGNPLIFHLATQDASSPTLAGRSTARCTLALSIFDATQDAATGTPLVTAQMTGMYYGNVSYSFAVDGAFRESVQFIGNDILVSNDDRILNTDEQTRANNADVDGQFTGEDDFFLNKREHILFDYATSDLDVNDQIADADCTILPGEIDGISDSGTNEMGDDGARLADIQSITVSASITREPKQALGSFEPVCQIIRFPLEVTTEISFIPRTSGLISATAIGILNTGTDACYNGPRNLKEWSIRIATCEGTRIYTGTKNRLRSYSTSGGDAGGNNMVMSYTYRTLNDFTVMHENDPHAQGATWWTNRETWLVTTP